MDGQPGACPAAGAVIGEAMEALQLADVLQAILEAPEDAASPEPVAQALDGGIVSSATRNVLQIAGDGLLFGGNRDHSMRWIEGTRSKAAS
jgi:hypothetical protein